MKIKILTLKSQILVFFTITCFCFICIYVNSMLKYTKYQKTIMEENQDLYSYQVVESAEKNYDDLRNIATSIAYNESVQQYLLEEVAEEKFNTYQYVMNLLNNTKSLNSSIIDISIFNNTDTSINTRGNISLYKYFYNHLPKNFESIRFLDRADINIVGTHYNCQIAAMPIYRLSNNTKEVLGILFLAINPSTIFMDDFDSSQDISNEIIFVNSNNQLIHGTQVLYEQIVKSPSNKIGNSIIYMDETYTCKQFLIENADGTLYTFFNQNIYTAKINKMIIEQLIFMILILLIASIIIIIFIKPTTQSLKQITTIMKKISDGKRRAMQERIPFMFSSRSCKEVNSIAISFNEMLDEIEHLNHTIFETHTKMYQLELSNKKRELSYLKNQINPHFLYNTLTLISGLASMNESERIIDISLALSQISRYSIKCSDIVTVKQELDISKSYLMIQRTRFDDRFDVEYDLTEEVYDALIPSMIIQPLVENSVKHGFEKQLTKGHLTIGGRIKKKDNTLVLWVYDTGVGMSEEQLSQLRLDLKNSIQNTSELITEDTDTSNSEYYLEKTGLGLKNINSRIHLYYGEPYALHIDSEFNIGTNIQIKIPYCTNQ